MTDLPAARQTQILEWLQDTSLLTIDALAERLHVSVMTIHRDLNQLVRAGHVEKVHGGVTLASPTPLPATAPTSTCDLCGTPITTRTLFTIQTQQAEQFQACCPHCGFLLLSELKTATSALAKDFLYGHMVNAGQAVYLLECDIQLCCVPTVLCFATSDDAQRFQKGFNGWLAAFKETQQFLVEHHGKIHHRD